MSILKQAGFLTGLDTLLEDVRKNAGVHSKKASEDTSHPTGKADDGTMPAKTGPRYAENSADIKEQYPNVSVEGEQGILNDGAPDKAQFDIGITSTVSGNDPENEKPKDSKTPDPGTSHPASTDRVEKYGSVSLRKGMEICEKLGQELLADINVAMYSQAAKTPVKTAAAPAQSRPAPAKTAAQANLEKAAAENQQLILQFVQAGELAADLYADYFMKAAADEATDDVEDAGGEEPTAPDEEPSSMDGGGEEASMGDVPGGDEALQAMLGGGGGMSPDAGGDPMAGGMPGGDPMAGGDPMGGGMPGEGGGDPMAGAGGSPEEIQALLESIPPEVLIEVLSQVMAEQDLSPDEMGKMGGAKFAAAAKNVKAYRRSGQFRMRPAKTAKEQQLRNLVHAHISELLPN